MKTWTNGRRRSVATVLRREMIKELPGQGKGAGPVVGVGRGTRLKNIGGRLLP